MKTTKKSYGITLVLTCCLAATLRAQHLYVVDSMYGTVGEYGLDGSTVNASLISGLDLPEGLPTGIAISGNEMFITDPYHGTVGKYTISGKLINANLISGLVTPEGIAVSGNNLFVTDSDGNCVNEYTTSGTPVAINLIAGLDAPWGIAISGNYLYVANYAGNERGPGAITGWIGKYTISGKTVNATLISGLLDGPSCMAISGTNLFIANQGFGVKPGFIAEYGLDGSTNNASLISGLDTPYGVLSSGNDLFVLNEGFLTDNPRVGEYTTSGSTVNAALISGFGEPTGIAISPPPLPVLSPLGFSNGQLQVSVVCSSNQTYIVQKSSNLVLTNWVSLLVTNPASSSFLFTDQNPTNQQQFYRIEIAQ